jgi:hypothetical protein
LHAVSHWQMDSKVGRNCRLGPPAKVLALQATEAPQ